jgi:hypothetical protein
MKHLLSSSGTSTLTLDTTCYSEARVSRATRKTSREAQFSFTRLGNDFLQTERKQTGSNDLHAFLASEGISL